MSVDVLLWIIRVWAILAGSACFPSIWLFVIFGKLNHNAYKQLRFYYLISGVNKFLLFSIAMILPTSGGNLHLSLDPQYFGVLYLWMLAVVLHSASTWSVMFSLTGISKPKESAA